MKKVHAHVTVYHNGDANSHSFIFVAGHPKIDGPPSEFFGHKRIRTVRLPKQIGNIKIVRGDYGKEHAVMGEIIYEVRGSTAVTSAYSPKAWVKGRPKRLGYFLEMIATRHLKKLGISHIGTLATAQINGESNSLKKPACPY